ncbi:pleckstrin homology domain-containing family O member 1 [Protopterus annectens]|uniref:pleckstrin homology domain-containing family O member 1 n=1 Tax=Protopterus annectens TaxID=7888 RepID=UPI001CF9F191|nr:pleckstrin homology domain-containing family O member 1 [Protopterus annectens]
MKKTGSTKRGLPDGTQQLQPEKLGWIWKYCGKGIFREIWKKRYVILKGEHLYISEKEVKDEKKSQEVFDLSEYEKCEELKKGKSRSKKNHSKFMLVRCRQPGNTAPNLIFLTVSPEEKEAWINFLNAALIRAKNRIFDEVIVEEDSYLAHLTRDRAKIQHPRRPPTRGHLMAVASTSTSDGMLTLDLIQEEDAPEDHGTCEESFRVDLESVAHLAASRRFSSSDHTKSSEKVHSGSVFKKKEISWDTHKKEVENFERGSTYTPQVVKKLSHSEKNKCASMEEILSRSDSMHKTTPKKGLEVRHSSMDVEQLGKIQDLITVKLEKTQELLTELKGHEEGKKRTRDVSPKVDSENIRQDTERLLTEAASNWQQAQKVLQEVKELRDLYTQLDIRKPNMKQKQQGTHSQYRKSMM